MDSLNFKQFYEFSTTPTNYFTAMQDELGVDPKAAEKTPMWAAGVGMGQISYNGMVYKINRIVRNNNIVTGAFISPINTTMATPTKAYVDKAGTPMKLPSSKMSTKEIFLPVEKLNTLMTQGFSSQPPGGMPV